ncbi:GNAT family N-acetyltransferase [Luteolibacter luteus]|uniref:GNAT family N-acetyltransferase n=1 Tax=Luteolibacter luteus TaxID=2728835 RepID=A0A858RFD9_9BACT|nr:GNAT family N-acetyltransferase [Luteolibacter luteus]QJE95826.1 GNAT family N-acetyltransferase [Luteolibacter luteus]
MPVTIRPAVPADLTDCALFFTEVFNAPPWDEQWTKESSWQRLSDCMHTPNFLGLIAEDGAEIVAMAFGYSQRYQEELHYNLLEFCVANERQGEGIGSELLAELHSRLLEAGVARVCTLTARDTPAQEFYLKGGFYISPKMILMSRRY